MSLTRVRGGIAAIGMLVATLVAGTATAQEITPSHLQAALAAVTSAGAARGFDLVLPAVAENVQNQLIRTRPDLHKEVSDAVEAVALTLVPRRQDLNNDIARIWASKFSEDELNQIAAFYQSPAGAKFATQGPLVIQEAYQVVQAWSGRVTEELLEKTREELRNRGVDF